jgi:hypothetical protein
MTSLPFLVSRIQTWALEEATRRLEKEGILPDPDDVEDEEDDDDDDEG